MNALRKPPKVTTLTDLAEKAAEAEAAQDVPKVRGLIMINGKLQGKVAVYMDPDLFLAVRAYCARTGETMTNMGAKLFAQFVATLPKDGANGG